MCDDQVRVISISVFPDMVICMCWEPLSSSPYLETWLDVVCYGCPILALELFPLFFFSLTKHRSKMLDQSDLWKAWFWLSVGGCHPSWQERHSNMKGSSRGSRSLSVGHSACTARKERGMLVLSWLPPSLPPFLFCPAPQSMGWCHPRWKHPQRQARSVVGQDITSTLDQLLLCSSCCSYSHYACHACVTILRWRV